MRWAGRSAGTAAWQRRRGWSRATVLGVCGDAEPCSGNCCSRGTAPGHGAVGARQPLPGTSRRHHSQAMPQRLEMGHPVPASGLARGCTVHAHPLSPQHPWVLGRSPQQHKRPIFRGKWDTSGPRGSPWYSDSPWASPLLPAAHHSPTATVRDQVENRLKCHSGAPELCRRDAGWVGGAAGTPWPADTGCPCPAPGHTGSARPEPRLPVQHPKLLSTISSARDLKPWGRSCAVSPLARWSHTEVACATARLEAPFLMCYRNTREKHFLPREAPTEQAGRGN